MQIKSLQDDKILSMLEGQEEYELYKEMLYLRSQLISPPPFTIPFFSCESLDKEGRVEDKREGLMHTWLRNYSNMFAMLCCGLEGSSTTFAAGHVNSKNTAGVVADSGDAIRFDDIDGAFGEDTVGIVIGRGAAAYSYEDFVLDSLIDHGTGANQMLHYDMFDHVQTWDGGIRQWTSVMKRYFVNRSGGAIGVTEAGILNNNQILMSRDVVSPTVNIDNDKACRVTYTTVSGIWPT